MNKEALEININWTALGAKLANLTDEEQRRFFIGFADELNAICTTYQKRRQLEFIRTGFTESQSQIYSDIGYETNNKETG